jgi:glycosyl transferase family 20
LVLSSSSSVRFLSSIVGDTARGMSWSRSTGRRMWLKDGMNLVAKEYCAAKTEVNGVLVLSEFAAAARELRAILVNLDDEVGVAAALKRALEMTPEERRRRMLRSGTLEKEHCPKLT